MVGAKWKVRPKEKECARCNQVKPIDQFYYFKKENYYSNLCKPCQSARQKEYSKKKKSYDSKLYYRPCAKCDRMFNPKNRFTTRCDNCKKIEKINEGVDWDEISGVIE